MAVAGWAETLSPATARPQLPLTGARRFAGFGFRLPTRRVAGALRIRACPHIIPPMSSPLPVLTDEQRAECRHAVARRAAFMRGRLARISMR